MRGRLAGFVTSLFLCAATLGQPRTPLTRGLADTLYCSLNGTCTVQNLTVLGTCSGCGAGITPPGSTTLNALARWGATDGSSLKNSIVTVADDGSIAGVKQISLDQGAGDVMFINATATGIQMTDIGTDGLTFNLGNLTANRSWTIGDVSGEPTIAGNVFSGTGSVVRATSPSLTTPTLGVATATSVNKVTITAPATGSTLTIADGKTLTASDNATVSGTNTGDQVIAGGNNILQEGNGAGGTSNSGITETAAGTLRSAAGVSLDLATAMRSSDAATVPTMLTSESAYEQASTNTTGAKLVLAGGIGTRKFTVVTFGSTGGKTVTVGITAASGTTSTTLTEGTDWTCVGTSNNTCATNLANAINANGTLGSKVVATTSSAIVGLQRKAGGNVYAITVSTNAGAPLTATSGNDGQIEIPIGTAALPAIVGQGGTVTGPYWASTLQYGIATNGVSRVLIDNNETRSSVNLATAANMVATSAGCFVFTSSGSTQGSLDTGFCRGAAAVTKVLAGTSGSGSLAYPAKAMTLSNGANNDLAIAGAGFVRVSGPTGAFSISGFAAGQDGEVLRVFNTTSQAMTITNQATSSSANQINTLTGADVVLRTGTSFATFLYDGTSSKWILTSLN